MATKHKSKSNNKMSPKFINIVVVIVLIILSLTVLANTMSKPIGRDEQMYCTGAVLLSQGKTIYRDFSYAAQMPYHPLLCAILFRLFNTTHYLLVGRIVSCVCDILVMLSIVGIYRYIFRSFTTSGMILGLAVVVMYVFNPLVDYANGYAWNHDIVILCVVLSFWLFISINFQHKSKYWRIAAIGALLTFATCMRVTTVLVELLFFVLLLCVPAGSTKERFKNALPFLLAGVVVAIWPVWVIAQAPRAFFLNLTKIPILYGQWLREIGMVYNKSFLIRRILTTIPSNVGLIAIAIFLFMSIAWIRSKLTISAKNNLLLVVLLPLLFFMIALIPPTMWVQYLAVPIPFFIMSFSYPLLYLKEFANRTKNGTHFRIACALISFCIVVTVALPGLSPDPIQQPPIVPSYRVVLNRTALFLTPENWVPIKKHKVSQDIAEMTKDPKLILTLGPLLALEGGCDIYTELSAGAIIYRIADNLSAEERQITHTAGVETLVETIKKNPPSAVILGVEMGRLEEPIYKLVVTPDWKIKDYENGPIAYFRP
jgi:hypothetical protein